MPAIGAPAAFVMTIVSMSILAAWVGVVLRLAFGMPVLPPNSPRSVPWGAGSVVLAIVAYLGIQVAVPLVYLSTMRPRPAGVGAVRSEMNSTEQMALMAAINACVIVVIPLVLKLTSGTRLRDFGIVARGFFQQVYRGLATYFLIAPLVFGVMIGSLMIWSKTPHPLEDAIKLDHSPAMLTVLVLASVVFAPMAEELIFRGVLLGWLTRLVVGQSKQRPADDFLGEPESSSLIDSIASEPGFDEGFIDDPHNPYAPPTTAIALTTAPSAVSTSFSTSQTIVLVLSNVFVSIIFAGLHSAVWPTPIPIFFLSLGLGFLYQRTGSLISSVTLHMMFNGVSTLLMLLTMGNAAPKPKEVPKLQDAIKKVQAQPAAIALDLNFFSKRSH